MENFEKQLPGDVLIEKSWIEMLDLLIGIIIFGIVVYIATYVRTIRKSRRESNDLFEKEN
jgi:hypothetical protein